MTKISFDAYQETAASTLLPGQSIHTIQDRFAEEIKELMTRPEAEAYGHLTRVLWGQEVPDVNERKEFIGEAGDIMWYLSICCTLGDLKLKDVVEKAVAEIIGSTYSVVAFADLDFQMKGRMGNRLNYQTAPEDYLGELLSDGGPIFETADQEYWRVRDACLYNPEFIKQLVDLACECEQARSNSNSGRSSVEAVLELSALMKSADPVSDQTKGLQLDGDGRYALARLLREAFETFDVVPRDYAAKRVGQAVCALSIVLQERVGSTLVEAVSHNTEKINRRRNRGTIASGVDSDRTDQAPNRKRAEQVHPFGLQAACTYPCV